MLPQILIFDNNDNAISPEKLIDIHRKIWSSDIVPIYYVFDDTDVRIFNSRKPISQDLKLDNLRLHCAFSTPTPSGRTVYKE